MEYGIPGDTGAPFLPLSFVSWPLQMSSFLCYALPATMSGITQAQRQMTKASEKWAEINLAFFSLWGGVLLCSRVTWSSWALPVSARHTLRSQVCATRSPSLSPFQAFLRDFCPSSWGLGDALGVPLCRPHLRNQVSFASQHPQHPVIRVPAEARTRWSSTTCTHTQTHTHTHAHMCAQSLQIVFIITIPILHLFCFPSCKLLCVWYSKHKKSPKGKFKLFSFLFFSF